MTAERLLGGRVDGAGVPDIISRATGLMRKARDVLAAPGAAAKSNAKKAVDAVANAVVEAKRVAGDAWKAMGEGAAELLADARKHVFGPMVALGLLYLVTR